MNIKVYKCSDELVKTEIKQISAQALEFMLKKNKNILKNVHISIKIDHEAAMAENAWGLCIWTDQMYKPKKFSIILSDKLSKKLFRKTLLHELVHVKQYLTSELKDCKSGYVKWKKKMYEGVDGYHEYINLPWEKQAYQFSEYLYKKLYI